MTTETAIGPVLAWISVDIAHGDVRDTLTLPIVPDMIASGLRAALRPGVLWDDRIMPFDQSHLGYVAEVIAYAINEGGIVSDTIVGDFAADEPLVTWAVQPDSVVTLRAHNVID